MYHPRFAVLRRLTLSLGLALPALGAEPIQVAARLEAANDVTVTWTDPDRAAAGHIVEFVNRPTDEWVILGFVPAGTNAFRHPRLAPETPYRYRVRGFYGPTSAPITVNVAEGLSDQAYADAYARPEDYSWAPPRHDAVAALRPAVSLRNVAPAASAAPAELKAEIIRKTVSGFRLTWGDRSNDEEGFLLERVDSPTAFVVCAMIPPDMNSFGWALEPPHRRATFRLRAFYFGPSSPVVSVMTHPDAAREPVPPRPPRGT